MGSGGEGIGVRALLPKALSRIASLKLTTALLLWIAVVCIAATVIPQQPLPIRTDASFMEWLLGMLTPSDIFHSAWLALPSLLLGLNLLGCMAMGLRSFLDRDSIPRMPGGQHLEMVLPAGMDPGKVQAGIARGLSPGYVTRQAVRGPAWMIFGEKSRVRAFAPVLTHGGILVILLGAALGTLGYRGSMEIPEGGAVDTAIIAGGGEMRLPFSVRCDRFSVEYYANGMPREYRSDLTFSLPGQADSRRPLMVNHPVRFGGILFSQSGFDPVLKARLGVRKKGTLYHALAEEKTYFVLDEERYQVNVVRLLQDVMHLGPAAELMIETPAGQKHLWVFKNFDSFRARFPGITGRMAVFDPSSVSPYTFTLEDMTTRYSTVLSLTRDPGEALMASGAILFLAGIFILFLVPASLIWVSLTRTEGGLRVKVVQSVNGRAGAPDESILEPLDVLKGGRP